MKCQKCGTDIPDDGLWIRCDYGKACPMTNGKTLYEMWVEHFGDKDPAGVSYGARLDSLQRDGD